MGCPCACDGKCCDKPDVCSTDHSCDESCEDVCEESYGLQCLNCGGECYHDV